MDKLERTQLIKDGKMRMLARNDHRFSVLFFGKVFYLIEAENLPFRTLLSVAVMRKDRTVLLPVYESLASIWHVMNQTECLTTREMLNMMLRVEVENMKEFLDNNPDLEYTKPEQAKWYVGDNLYKKY
jgi:hypothetical protein